MYFVYIIYSQGFDKYYIGQTNDFTQRLLRHNSGSEVYTRKYKLWQTVLVISKPSRVTAMELERKLKNLNRARLKLFIDKYS